MRINVYDFLHAAYRAGIFITNQGGFTQAWHNTYIMTNRQQATIMHWSLAAHLPLLSTASFDTIAKPCVRYAHIIHSVSQPVR